MSTASQIIPPNHGLMAEPLSAAMDDAVTKSVRRKYGASRRRCSVMATKSRARQQADRVREQRLVLHRLWRAFFCWWERGSVDPAPHSHHVFGGLANKENFSKQNRKIAGNGSCGSDACQRTVCTWDPSIVAHFYLYSDSMSLLLLW